MPHPQQKDSERRIQQSLVGPSPAPQALETAGAPCRRKRSHRCLLSFAGTAEESSRTRAGASVCRTALGDDSFFVAMDHGSPSQSEVSGISRRIGHDEATEQEGRLHLQSRRNSGGVVAHRRSRTMRSASFVLAAITSGNRCRTSRERARFSDLEEGCTSSLVYSNK